MEVTNRYVTIKNHIDGQPKENDFEVKSEALCLKLESGCNAIIVKNIYISIDAGQMNRMKSHSSTQSLINESSRITPGQIINGFAVGKVVASESEEFKENELVAGFLSWAEYSVVILNSDIHLWKVDLMGFPLSYHASILGISGFTAYVGFFEICKPKKGDRVFVSAASGSVGHLVGQYAKLFGCYVVGCAGTDEKVQLLKGKLGFDEAFNYKEEPDLKATLKRYFPDGIDIYFDNVGAEIQEAAIANMNLFGRVAVCGVISEYADSGKRKAAPDMLDVVYRRLRVQGFVSLDYMNLFDEFVSTTSDHIRRGEMQSLEYVSDGIESAPSAFVAIFRGLNVGKTLVQVSEV